MGIHIEKRREVSRGLSPESNSRTFIFWMLSAAVYLACSLISFTLLSEDAYISFRYAENISGGYGPVFNQGGPTIEGYSNPLWVWLLALSHLLGADVVVAGRCFGLLFSTLCLLEIILIFK